MNVLRWAPLTKGDIVDIIAPGFACDQSELEQTLKFVKALGLKPRTPKKLFGRHLLCSHDDEQRWYHLKEALTNTESRAIWCLRGGYGSIRLLPYLSRVRRVPRVVKPLIGLSDITTLQTFLLHHWQWPSIHGPLVNAAAMGRCSKASVRELMKLLFGQPSLKYDRLKPLNEKASQKKQVWGRLEGGNLAVLQSTVGTKYSFSGDGAILFFEDIGERGYRVDRMLRHLEIIGAFKGCRGVVFGEFVGGREAHGRSLVLPVLKEFAARSRLPVYSGFPCGHGKKQFPLVFGARARLQGGPTGTLHIESHIDIEKRNDNENP